ncbi:MAG: glycosyltransferase family 2 protein [Deltaproteobacteria bacterium]|nr:glycosyltransferase family 2 protein [Deltaproteobacteria bacterium]
MSQPVISVIIVNWNGLKFLKGCLRTLLLQSFSDFETIVVDNGSVDGSVAFIRDSYLTVKVIENSENRGFATANNQGLGVARGRYVAFLNNDTEVDREWLSNLAVSAESSPPDVGMWAPKILSLDDRATIDSVGGLLISTCCIAKGRGRGERDKGQYDGVSYVFIPSACSAMYRREMIDDVGGFDEEFFAYCEDTDLGMRARLRGWKTCSVPKAVVYHHYSGTAGRYSPTKAFLVERNHIWVAVKNLPLPMVVPFPIFTVWRYLLQSYGVITQKGAGGRYVKGHSRGSLLRLLGNAWLGAAKGLPGMLKKRARVQGSRVAPNGEVMRWFSRYRISLGDLVFKE